jgi:hypothetical protein
MGRCYAFTCPKCNFVAHVSGGEDGGMHCFTRTIHCLDCQDLFDVVTHLRQKRLGAFGLRKGVGLVNQAPKSWLPLPLHTTCSGLVRKRDVRLTGKVLPAGRFARWLEFHLQCPNGKRHRIQDWTAPGRCPRCGTFLDQTVVHYRIWD